MERRKMTNIPSPVSNGAASKSSGAQQSDRLDALIVGAGFAGIYMLYKLLSLRLRVLLVEEGSGVGGTWYWNRYPGARCDVESVEYLYSFSEDLLQDWTWSHRYSTQPEIMAYANHVVDRFNLRPFMQFNTRVISRGLCRAHEDVASGNRRRGSLPRSVLHHGYRNALRSQQAQT